MNNFPIKLSGKIWWLTDPKFNETETIIKEAIYSKSELTIDFVYEGYKYTLKLMSSDGTNFAGKFSGRKEADLTEGTVECMLYENDEGYFLYGDTWREENYDMEWFAKLDRDD